MYKFNKLVKFASPWRCCTKDVTVISTKMFMSRAIELIENLFFCVAYEKVSIVGTHFGTHGHAIGLRIKFPGERKAVKGEHKFS